MKLLALFVFLSSAANPTLTALAPGFDYANGELQAAKKIEKSEPQSAFAKYQMAAQYADGLLASIEPLQKAGQLKLDGTVTTTTAGTMSAKDFLAKIKSVSKDGKAGVERLKAKVGAMEKQQADADRKQREAELAKREKADADLLAKPPPEYGKVFVTNTLGEPICEVTTTSQSRGHKQLKYLRGKPPLPPKKALSFPIAPGKHSLLVAGCGKANARRVGAVALRVDPQDRLDVEVKPKAKVKNAVEWRIGRTAAPKPKPKPAPARNNAAAPAPAAPVAYAEPTFDAYEPIYEQPQEVAPPVASNDANDTNDTSTADAPPAEVEEPPPPPAPEPQCKPDGAACETSSECCHTCKMEEVQDETSGAWHATGRAYCSTY